MIKADNKLFCLVIFCNNDVVFEIFIRRQTDAFALSDGVAMQTAMLPENFAVERYNVPRDVRNVFFEKIIDRYATASEEANALAVFASGVR